MQHVSIFSFILTALIVLVTHIYTHSPFQTSILVVVSLYWPI